MKLVESFGKTIENFDGGAELACRCVCSSGTAQNARNSARWNPFNNCSCSCDYGSANRSANDSKAD